MEKFYLGMSFSHNSSACVVSSERGVLAAISQERLNGEKNTKELPFDAAVKCCELSGVYNFEALAVSHYENMSTDYLEKYGKKYNLHGDNWHDMIRKYFRKYTAIDFENIYYMHHHLAHAYATTAFYDNPKMVTISSHLTVLVMVTVESFTDIVMMESTYLCRSELQLVWCTNL